MTAVAFEQTAIRHRPRLVALSRRQGLPTSDAEDAVQRALLTLWRRRARIDPTRAVGLMLVAVQGEIRHWWRSQPHGTPVAAEDAAWEEPAGLLARRRAVWAALEGLSLPDRELVWRAWVRQEPLSLLAIARKTHRVTLWRHLQGLRAHLARELAAWDPTRGRRHPVNLIRPVEVNRTHRSRPWGRVDRILCYSALAAP